jgi:purine-binding chemotaxis protein CheW
VNAVVRPIAAPCRWVTFALDDQRFALPLDSVLRVVHAAEITPLPLAPFAVAGALDVAGSILPVFDVRRRLGLPERDLRLSDQFLIARTPRRTVALIVDAALGLVDAIPADDPVALAPGLRHLRGVLSLPDGLVLIQDLEEFLSPAEETALDSALRTLEDRRAR